MMKLQALAKKEKSLAVSGHSCCANLAKADSDPAPEPAVQKPVIKPEPIKKMEPVKKTKKFERKLQRKISVDSDSSSDIPIIGAEAKSQSESVFLKSLSALR